MHGLAAASPMGSSSGRWWTEAGTDPRRRCTGSPPRALWDHAAGAGGPKPELLHGVDARARSREPSGITRAHSSTGAKLIPRLPLASRFRHDGGKCRRKFREDTMSGREDMERTLRDAYAARQRGDLDALGRLFAPHARFQMARSSGS